MLPIFNMNLTFVNMLDALKWHTGKGVLDLVQIPPFKNLFMI